MESSQWEEVATVNSKDVFQSGISGCNASSIDVMLVRTGKKKPSDRGLLEKITE